MTYLLIYSVFSSLFKFLRKIFWPFSYCPISMGYNDQSLIDKIKTTMEQHDANLSRSGYYQQGR